MIKRSRLRLFLLQMNPSTCSLQTTGNHDNSKFLLSCESPSALCCAYEELRADFHDRIKGNHNVPAAIICLLQLWPESSALIMVQLHTSLSHLYRKKMSWCYRAFNKNAFIDFGSSRVPQTSFYCIITRLSGTLTAGLFSNCKKCSQDPKL